MITLTLVGALALLINLKVFNDPIITLSLGGCVVATTLIGWLILDDRPFMFLERLCRSRFAFLDKVLAKINSVKQAIKAFSSDPRALWIAFANSLIFIWLAIINVWVSSLAFSADIEFMPILISVPVIMIIMNLPISIGGIGLLEFAFTFTFELIGYPTLVAVSAALLLRLKTIIDGAIGGTCYFLSDSRKYSSISKSNKDY
jgi:uncharacterized protein (TIRG00374 family)